MEAETLSEETAREINRLLKMMPEHERMVFMEAVLDGLCRECFGDAPGGRCWCNYASPHWTE
jgi:hypothetical protein